MEAIAVQKAVLKAGCTVGGVPYLPDALLNDLGSDELSKLYDLYMLEIKFVDPKFEALEMEQILEIVESVKKKKTAAKDYFTWQHAAIGRYFLAKILPMDNAHGR